jgi:hypothetical protein
MPTPNEARQAFAIVTNRAVAAATKLVTTATTDDLLEAIPQMVAYFSDGTAALAADHYDDLREEANVPGRYTAEPVVNLRDEKIRRGVLWAVEPLYLAEPVVGLATERLAQVVSLETARPFRDTIITNQADDPQAVGWQRHSRSSGCRFCRMLAGRGAVYRQATARFASHPHCSCTAAPVFSGTAGPEASTLQYIASQRRRSEADKARLRAYLAALPD